MSKTRTSAPNPDRGFELLSEKEVARLTGFSVRTLQGWRWRGTGPLFIRVSARCIRYRRQDVERWLEQRLRSSTSDPGGAP